MRDGHGMRRGGGGTRLARKLMWPPSSRRLKGIRAGNSGRWCARGHECRREQAPEKGPQHMLLSSLVTTTAVYTCGRCGVHIAVRSLRGRGRGARGVQLSELIADRPELHQINGDSAQFLFYYILAAGCLSSAPGGGPGRAEPPRARGSNQRNDVACSVGTVGSAR
jgi:hypothetical protein